MAYIERGTEVSPEARRAVRTLAKTAGVEVPSDLIDGVVKKILQDIIEALIGGPEATEKAAKYRRLADETSDGTLRRGYLTKAAQLTGGAA